MGRRLLQGAAALIWLSSLFLGGVQSLGGEKIQITGPAESANLPKEAIKEYSPPGSLKSRIGPGESSKGPIVPQPGQPTYIRNPKLDELIDKRKNWIFDSPNSLDRKRDVEEIFGVRKYEPDTLENKPKGAVERYFESTKDTKTGSKDSRSPSESADRDRLSPNDELDPSKRLGFSGEPQSLDPGGIIPALNPAQLFNWDIAPQRSPQTSVFGGSTALPRNPVDSTWQKQPGTTFQPANAGQRDFDKLWDSRKSPLTRFTDPINSQADATRSVLNPITARKTSVPPPESSQSSIGSAYAFGNRTGASTRPDFFSASKPREASGPSFTPPIAAASGPSFQAKPAVLEIPRPKF